MCSPFLKFNATQWAALKSTTDPTDRPTYRSFTQESGHQWRSFSEKKKRDWIRACLGEDSIDCQECLKHCGSPRKLTPFMKFSQQHRAEHKGNMVERAKALGARWRAMSKTQRASYA